MSKRDHYYRNVSTFNIIYLSNSKFQLKKNIYSRNKNNKGDSR